MKAARLHAYREPLKLDSVEEPTAVNVAITNFLGSLS